MKIDIPVLHHLVRETWCKECKEKVTTCLECPVNAFIDGTMRKAVLMQMGKMYQLCARCKLRQRGLRKCRKCEVEKELQELYTVFRHMR